ncbi:MAG: hypothetical protein HDS42_06735 [Bacteroides sp.]|nr:hypothetical protein [Bacteroides sp.]
MTPREFFDRAIGEDSKFVLAKMVKEVEEECKGDLLQYFIEDIKTIADKWRKSEKVTKWNEADSTYWSRCDSLNSDYIEYNLPQEVYIERLKEIERERPLPFEFYATPPLPDSLQWALGKLEEVIITDSVIDTSTNELNTSTGLSPDGLGLPMDLNTDRARKYFNRAIERGFIKPISTGFEWIPIMGRGANAQLGYFLSKIYSQPRPINALERLFDVKKLSTYLSNAEHEVKRADVIKWRAEIDNIFND